MGNDVNETEVLNETEPIESDDEMKPYADETDQEQIENVEEQEEEISFDDILAIPELKSEFDRRVSQAINTYARRHPAPKPVEEEHQYGKAEELDEAKNDDDIESYINDQIEARIIAMRFENCLNRQLENAGIVDTTGYLAHVDLQDLVDHYNPQTDEIEGYEDLEMMMREEFPMYFGTEATGADHGTFGGYSEPVSLGDALRERYAKKH